jgi:uncharacterized membrane protein
MQQQEKLRDEWTLRHGQQRNPQKLKPEDKDPDVEEALNQLFCIATGRGVRCSNILVLTFRCNLINSAFQIFPLFIPEMPAGFSSYVVQVIPIYVSWILKQFGFFPLI